MNRRTGLSLVEILLALVIMSGSVIALMQGLEVQEILERQSRFETLAALFAERELELLKSDLASGRRPLGPRGVAGRFRLPGGWKTRLIWTAPDEDSVCRLIVRISRGDETFACESFVALLPASAASPLPPRAGKRT